MLTYNYFCTNSEGGCKEAFKNVHITKEESEAEDIEPCECCGEPMKCVGYIPSGGYLKSSAMSKEQKRDMLKKRSKAHFKKEIKERQHEIIKKTDKGFFHSQP